MKSFEFSFGFPNGVESAKVGFQFVTEKVKVGAPSGLDGICYVPCQSYLGPGFGSGQGRGSDGHGFSEWVAALTCLSCPGFSCGGGLVARSDGERSRGARRLRVQSGQYFTAMLFDN